MDILEKIYILTEEAAIATLGVGCDNWKRCKCEDCVLLRKTIVKTLQKIGYNRRQIATYTGVSRSAIASYLSDDRRRRAKGNCSSWSVTLFQLTKSEAFAKRSKQA